MNWNKARVSDDFLVNHDDAMKHWKQWKHFPRYWPFVRGIHRSPVNSPHKGQWRGALMFSLICVWINDWVKNRETGDLRSHCAHYDVIVMTLWHFITYPCLNRKAHMRPKGQTSLLLSVPGCDLSQWETTLHCNIVSHWLSPYPDTVQLWDRWCLKSVQCDCPYHCS